MFKVNNKDIVNRFREKLKILILGIKVPITSHFGHNKKFPSNPKQPLLTTFNACHQTEFQEKYTE